MLSISLNYLVSDASLQASGVCAGFSLAHILLPRLLIIVWRSETENTPLGSREKFVEQKAR
jgi:hypothetical protein